MEEDGIELMVVGLSGLDIMKSMRIYKKKGRIVIFSRKNIFKRQMRLSLGSEQKLCKRKYFQGKRVFMEESKQKEKNDKIKLTENLEEEVRIRIRFN